MIKNRNEKQQERKQTIENSQSVNSELLKIKKVQDFPGDVIVGNYVLKSFVSVGTVDQVKTTIAAKISEGILSGHKLIDRIPANHSESILVFERIAL